MTQEMPPDGITPFPYDHENHQKNSSLDMQRSWFFTAYPKATQSHYERYRDTQRCDICSVKLCSCKSSPPNKKVQDTVNGEPFGVICYRCSMVLGTVLDLEHLSQIKDYLKEKNL